MTGDVGIRPGSAAPIETQVAMTTATREPDRCAHGRALWIVGGERWHASRRGARDSRCELLEPCASAPVPS